MHFPWQCPAKYQLIVLTSGFICDILRHSANEWERGYVGFVSGNGRRGRASRKRLGLSIIASTALGTLKLSRVERRMPMCERPRSRSI